MKKALSALAKQMRTHVLKLPFGEQLVYCQGLLFGSDYGWGKEIIGSADCSGAICFALWLLGYNIRTNATGLFRFCREVNGLPKAGDLAFWRKIQEVGEVPSLGYMQHVSMFSDHMLVIDSTLRFYDTPLTLLQSMYFEKNGLPVFARFDREVLTVASEADRDSWDVDDELAPLFGAFKGLEEEK